MHPNTVLRRLRYALDLPDAEMTRVFALSGAAVEPATLSGWLSPDTDPQFVACTDRDLGAFLDGLVVDRRGPRDPALPPLPVVPIDNNQVLKKLRIALELHEDDMLAVLALGEMPLSASELGALFRKPGHVHYRECGDQLLRNFLDGLTARLRQGAALPRKPAARPARKGKPPAKPAAKPPPKPAAKVAPKPPAKPFATRPPPRPADGAGGGGRGAPKKPGAAPKGKGKPGPGEPGGPPGW